MLLCRNEEVFKMKQRINNNNKNNLTKHIAVLLGICILGGALTGCGFVANPMQYMKDADEELVAAEQNTDESASGSNSSAGASGDSSGEVVQVTDNKIIVIGTYGSVSDMINADDYKSQADIECIQETRDFDDTSDMLAVAKKVQESCDTDAESVIVSVRSRIYEQISYFLQHTINTSKGLLVIREDAKDTDYNTTFAEALKVAVEPEDYNAGVTKTTTSGNNAGNTNIINDNTANVNTTNNNAANNMVNSAGVSDVTTEKTNSNNYIIMSGLTDIDVIDISGVNSLPYVNIVYDYVGNDAYAAEKVFNTSEGVVVVTENSDGSLSPAMSQLVKDVSSSIPIVILCSSGYDAADMAQERFDSCIATSNMSAEQARIMSMLCITHSKNINDWKVYFTHKSL